MPLYFPKGEGKLLIDGNGNVNATGIVPINSPTGTGNIAIGTDGFDPALNALDNISGSDCIAIGTNTLTLMESANANIFGNIAIGANAFSNLLNIGANDGVNTALGLNAGFFLTEGNNNTLIGEAAGIGPDPGATPRLKTGDNNTLIGSQTSSLDANGAMSRGTALGVGAIARSNSTAIGQSARVTKTNQVMLGTAADEVHCPGTLATDFTNTAVVGDVTINKISGRVNIAAAGSSIVVTNNKVTVNSRILAVVSSNDATAIVKNVVPANGSFTINLDAAATAQTSIDFFVFN